VGLDTADIGVRETPSRRGRDGTTVRRVLGVVPVLLCAGLVSAASAGALADNREWEMVSPPEKGGALGAQSLEGAVIQASEDGNAITYGAEASGPVGEPQGNRSIAVTQFVSTRSPSTWSTQDIVTPNNKAEGITPGSATEYKLFSGDLSISIVEPEVHSFENHAPLEEPPLAPPLQPGERQEKTIYIRADPPLSPGAAEQAIYEEAAANNPYLAPGYFALVTQLNDTAHEPFGESLEFLNATLDLNHVAIASTTPLTPEAGGRAGVYEWSSNAPGHALQLVSIAKNRKGQEEPAIDPQLGGIPSARGEAAISRNAMSRDGARIIFTSAFVSKEGEENARALLFLREPGKHETVQVNAAQGEATEPSEAKEANEELIQARFQTASTDGSKIFFTDTRRLTTNSKLKPNEKNHSADLYEFNADTRKLTDLTVPQAEKELAEVQRTIPGASEDGSRVYFVANGVLAPGATEGNCGKTELPEEAECNLYVSQPDPNNPGARETKLIARLSALDGADWGAPVPPAHLELSRENLTYVTSRVSPGSGEYLAFMSQQPLAPYENETTGTAYDNEDANANTPDEEVYLYKAASGAQRGKLVCVSCRPDGERPLGVFDHEKAGEGLGLLVDRPEVWKNRWISGSIPGWTALSVQRSIYQSRYLSEDGRLFFNSSDRLVPEDENEKENQEHVREGVEDVYEYQPNGTGECAQASGCLSLVSSGAKADTHESAFLDASVTGNDVFFLTSEKLVPQIDTDGAFDVYDARVCGTSESGACLPPFSPAPAECEGEGCRPPVSGPTSFSVGGTATFSGPGNTPTQAVLPSKVGAPAKQPTRAQKLAKALKSCRAKYKSKRKTAKRHVCEKQARRKFGAKKTSKHKTGSGS
jgi:hypothetical protein